MGMHWRAGGEDRADYCWLIFTAGPRSWRTAQTPAANQLYNTPGYHDPKRPLNYEVVKADFDELQYWVNVLKGDYGKFDPYVALVHGPDYLECAVHLCIFRR